MGTLVKTSIVGVVASLCAVQTGRAAYDTFAPAIPDPVLEMMQGNAVQYGTQFVGRNLSLTKPSVTVPIPPNGSFFAHSFFDVFTEISLDGGQTFTPGSTTADVMINAFANSAVGGTQVINTEMLQMNLVGGTLPPGVMIRESPTLPSIGKTTITDLGGGLYHIDSFFDVFTELSVDGGQSWMPSNNSTRVIGNPEPGTLALLSLGVLGALRRGRTRA